jgi:hypothetical protein
MSALTWKLGLAGKSHGRASTVVRLVTCRPSRDDALVGFRRHPGGQRRETSPAHVFARKSSGVELGLLAAFGLSRVYLTVLGPDYVHRQKNDSSRVIPTTLGAHPMGWAEGQVTVPTDQNGRGTALCTSAGLMVDSQRSR